MASYRLYPSIGHISVDEIFNMYEMQYLWINGVFCLLLTLRRWDQSQTYNNVVHPACDLKGYIHLGLYLRGFVAMQVQQFYTSSINGSFRTHILTLPAIEIRRKVHFC